MIAGGRKFVLPHGADRTCAVIVNENQFLVIGGYTDRDVIGGAITDGQGGGIHGKVHRYGT